MDANGYFKRAEEFVRKNDYDNAIADWSEVIRLTPNNASAYYNRAMSYDNKRDTVRSISDYTDAIRLGLDNTLAAVAYYNRGVSYKQKGVYVQAIADFEMASSLNPYDSETRDAIEKTKSERLHKSDHEYARAQILDKEIKETKLKDTIYDSMGNLREIENSALAYYNRGMVYKGLEYYTSAIEDLEKAVELEPADDNYRKALDEIKAVKQAADELRRKRASKVKRNKIIRCVIGGIIYFFIGATCGAVGTTITLIIGALVGAVIGVIIALNAGDCTSAGDGAGFGALAGAISFAIISAVSSKIGGGSLFMGILGAFLGAIGGAIIGALSGGILSDYDD